MYRLVSAILTRKFLVACFALASAVPAVRADDDKVFKALTPEQKAKFLADEQSRRNAARARRAEESR